MRLIAILAAAMTLAAKAGLAQPDDAISFHNETCGRVSLTLQNEAVLQAAAASPAGGDCVDADGCQTVAIGAGETEGTSSNDAYPSQLMDVKIEGRCDDGHATVISGHCVLDLSEESGDGYSAPVASALDQYYFSSADPYNDLIQRRAVQKAPMTAAPIAISLTDCQNDGVRRVCTATCVHP